MPNADKDFSSNTPSDGQAVNARLQTQRAIVQPRYGKKKSVMIGGRTRDKKIFIRSCIIQKLYVILQPCIFSYFHSNNINTLQQHNETIKISVICRFIYGYRRYTSAEQDTGTTPASICRSALWDVYSLLHTHVYARGLAGS
jgi:hypothetical protein